MRSLNLGVILEFVVLNCLLQVVGSDLVLDVDHVVNPSAFHSLDHHFLLLVLDLHALHLELCLDLHAGFLQEDLLDLVLRLVRTVAHGVELPRQAHIIFLNALLESRVHHHLLAHLNEGLLLKTQVCESGLRAHLH